MGVRVRERAEWTLRRSPSGVVGARVMMLLGDGDRREEEVEGEFLFGVGCVVVHMRAPAATRLVLVDCNGDCDGGRHGR